MLVFVCSNLVDDGMVADVGRFLFGWVVPYIELVVIMVFWLMFVLQIVLPECCDVLCVIVKCCTFEHALFLYDQ